MTITIHFGWWLLPFFLSLPFVFLSIKEWLSTEQGLSGAFSALVALFWMLFPTMIWLIYFVVLYCTGSHA